MFGRFILQSLSAVHPLCDIAKNPESSGHTVSQSGHGKHQKLFGPSVRPGSCPRPRSCQAIAALRIRPETNEAGVQAADAPPRKCVCPGVRLFLPPLRSPRVCSRAPPASASPDIIRIPHFQSFVKFLGNFFSRSRRVGCRRLAGTAHFTR